MPRVRSLRLTLVVLALLPVFACAPAKKSGGGDDKKLVIWEQMDPEERARFERNLDAFRASHPGIEIQHLPFDTEQLRTQYQTAVAGGSTTPDVIFGPSDQVGPLSLLKLIRPLDETLPKGFFDRFIPAALDTLDGHLWAAPDQVGNHLVLCYDRAKVPQAPETAEQFLAIAQRLTRPGKSGAPGSYGFAMNLTEPYWLVPFLGGYGGWVMDANRQPTLDSPAMVQALTYLRDLKDRYKVMPRESDYMGAETMFKEKRVAMIVNGPWSWSGYRKAGLDLGVAPIFKLPNGEWARPMVASKGYSINVNVPEAKLPLVIELVTYLTSAEAETRGADTLGVLPSVKDAYQDPVIANDPTLRESQRAFELGRRMPVVPEMRVIWDVMRPEMQNVMNGAKTPEQAAKDMQTNAVQQIAAMRK